MFLAGLKEDEFQRASVHVHACWRGRYKREREKESKTKKTDPITDLGRESEFLTLESLAVCFTNAFLVIEYATWLHYSPCLLPIGEINPSEQAKVINKDC